MLVLAWICIGIVTGILGNRPIRRPMRAILLDVFLGIVGAVMSGWLVSTFRGGEGRGILLSTLPILGAVLTLSLYHAVARRHVGDGTNR